jgi:hypothetical protein
LEKDEEMFKKKWQKFILLSLLVVYPLIAGCLTDVPFNVKTGNFNLTLQAVDTYREVKATIPEEAQFPGSIIDNAIVEYQIENLSEDKDASITIYTGSAKGLLQNGKEIITRNVSANNTIEGSFSSKEIIDAIQNGSLYLGAKCDQNSEIAITFNIRITGSYNIAKSISGN